jgi:RNA polymerase sigma factor (sigma-70 family)
MGTRVAIGVIQLAAKAAGLGQRTDPELLADFLDRHDSSAFEALVRRHGPLVLAACRQVLRDESAAEDAFQATFVTLYQKAASIRRRPSLGGWLFRIARRTALRARRADGRRARHEAGASAKHKPEIDLLWREGVVILHEELDRLPDTYRNALILCYLEGLPRDDAARRLGWTINELRGRLERGRARLRSRLKARGVTLSAGLVTAIGVTALPPTLVASTVAGAGRPSVRVASLAATGAWGKFKAITALAVAAGLVFGFGIAGKDPQAGAQPPATEAQADLTIKANHVEPPAPKDARVRTGRVLDPDGKPVAGAKVWLIVPWVEAREVARSEADGTFRLPANIKDADKLTEYESVIRTVATHERFGLALPAVRADDEIELRMVKDEVPIRGRVLDLQGKPVAGVTITPQRVQAASNESLDGWLTKLKAAEDQVNVITDGALRRRVGPTPFLAPVTTDDQGRFTLTGVGRERLVELRIAGPTIAMSEAWVMTRAVPDIRVEYDPGNSKLGYKLYHGATFDFAAEPTQPFEGVVTDRESGKPIPKAVVRSEYPFRIESVADAEGRYTLRGLGPGEHKLIASPPIGEPNLPMEMAGGRVNNQQPVRLDFALSRGVWIEGTVTNARTKKPIAGASIYYTPLGEGAVVRFGGDPLAFDEAAGRTDADGKFRIVGVPGSGAIAVHAPDGPYIDATRRPLQGDSLFWSLDGVRVRWMRLYFAAFDALAVVELDAKKPRTYAITVDPGETIRGRILDPDGKPLAGARASRLTEYSGWTMKPLAAEFEAGQIQAGKPRFVLFWHEERKLGAIWRPRLGSSETNDVKLKPNASAVGRMTSKEGEPLSDHTIEVYFRTSGDTVWTPWFPMKTVRTDARGRFELSNLPEGVEFSLRMKPKKVPVPSAHEFRVNSGEAKDLGDIKPR